VVIGVALAVLRLWSRSTSWRAGSVAVIGSLIVMNTIALVRLNQDWRAAGDVTESVLDELARLSREDESTLLVVGLPDRIGDAYVFRNGFRSAVQRAGIEDTHLVALNDGMEQPKEHPRNRVDVEPDGDALLFTTAFPRWLRLADREPVFETDPVNPSSFRLSARAGTRIVVYSQGVLRDARLPETHDVVRTRCGPCAAARRSDATAADRRVKGSTAGRRRRCARARGRTRRTPRGPRS